MRFNHRIEQAISTARLSTYRARTSSDEQAWELYIWNMDLTAALIPLAADLEVTLRNTLHLHLSEHFARSDWWASTKLLLDDVTAGMLTKVVRKHQKRIANGTVSADKVVADSTLGVWVHLLGRGGHSALGRAIDYERNLWRPALRFGFATGEFTPDGRQRRPKRDDVFYRAALFRQLRNRAAHHEPLFDGIAPPGTGKRIPLDEVSALSVQLLGWMSPELAQRHTSRNEFRHVLDRRPEP